MSQQVWNHTTQVWQRVKKITIPLRASEETGVLLTIPREVLLLILMVLYLNLHRSRISAVLTQKGAKVFEYKVFPDSCHLSDPDFLPKQARSKAIIDASNMTEMWQKSSRNKINSLFKSYVSRKYNVFTKRGKDLIRAKWTVARVLACCWCCYHRSQRLRGNQSLMAALRNEWKAVLENSI